MTNVDMLWLRVISPFSWPVWLRRLFLVGLPISVPLYLIVLLVLAIALLFVRIGEPLREFWNSPQRKVRINMYDYYRYSAGKKDAEGPEDLPSQP